MTTKEDIIAEIALLIELPMPNMSHGSREPQVLFTETLFRLGLSGVGLTTKHDIAEYVITISGLSWTPSCWSRGGTITMEGLLQLKKAVQLLLGK